VQACDLTAVELLLNCPRVDVNLADNNGYTPLIWAADIGFLDIVKLLLCRYDIEVNKKDNTGYTALHWAADLGRERVVRALLSHEHTDADARDEDGNSALVWAADRGQYDCARYLMRAGADVNLAGKDGITPLICAAGGGFEQVVTILLNQQNIDVCHRDDEGYTALIAAVKHGHRTVSFALQHHIASSSGGS